MRKKPKEEAVCSECGANFLMDRYEKARQTKKGRTEFFCSMSHHATFQNKKKHPARIAASRKTLERLRLESKTVKFDPVEIAMRFHLRVARKRKHDCNLTLSDLKNLWEIQDGKCAISGLPLLIKGFERGKHTMNRLNSASLDRINSNEGYTIGNVQFIAYGLNLAKSTFSNDEMAEFVQSIRNT